MEEEEDTNAQFTDPLPGQLANIAAPMHHPTWQHVLSAPPCGKCLNFGFLLTRAASALSSALVFHLAELRCGGDLAATHDPSEGALHPGRCPVVFPGGVALSARERPAGRAGSAA